MFFFIDYSDPLTLSIERTDDDNHIKMWLCLQEILLKRGECDFDINLGIDYDSIFSENTFIGNQIDEILDKYRKYFRAIDYNITQEKNKVAVNLEFSFNFENSPSLGRNSTKKSQQSKSFKVILGKNKGIGEIDVFA